MEKETKLRAVRIAKCLTKGSKRSCSKANFMYVSLHDSNERKHD